MKKNQRKQNKSIGTRLLAVFGVLVLTCCLTQSAWATEGSEDVSSVSRIEAEETVDMTQPETGEAELPQMESIETETAAPTEPEQTEEMPETKSEEESVVPEAEAYEETPVDIADSPEEAAALLADAAEDSDVDLSEDSIFAAQSLLLFVPQSDTIQTYGAESAVYYDDFYTITYASVSETEEAYAALVEEYGEEAVQIDFLLHTDAEGWGYDHMYFDPIVEESAKGEEVVVAVLDSGINPDHEIFSNTDLIGFCDLVNSETDMYDDMGHGTNVAGIIAESTPSNIKIMPIKIVDYDRKSGENVIKLSLLYLGLNKANDQGADIINLSIGESLLAYQSSFNTGQTRLAHYKQPIICAAGNKNQDIDETLFFPAAAKTTIAVSGINKQWGKYGASNYGASIDFTAPGESLRIATPNGGYKTGSGTSYSTPYISAVAAMLLAEHPDYDREEVYQALVDLCVDLGDAGKDVYFGNGCPVFSSVPLSDCTIPDLTTQTYTGNAILPEPTLAYLRETLQTDMHFQLSYTDNVNVGTAKVTITGAGRFTGSATKTFQITPAAITDVTVAAIPDQIYDGKAKTPLPTLTFSGKTLQRGTEYTLTYQNNTEIGTATITITGKGNFTGSRTVTFRVVGSGFVERGGKTYYYDPNSHQLVHGQKKIGNFWYMFHPTTGVMQTGFYNHTTQTNPKGGAKTCYYDASGHMVYGQKKIGNYWYMFHPSSGAMIKGFYNHTTKTNPKGGAKTCYYDASGHMVYGQKKIGNYWYMFHPSSGAMIKGFYNHTAKTNPKGGAKTCYYDAKGHMVYGWQTIGGKRYYFHPSSGALKK